MSGRDAARKVLAKAPSPLQRTLRLGLRGMRRLLARPSSARPDLPDVPDAPDLPVTADPPSPSDTAEVVISAQLDNRDSDRFYELQGRSQWTAAAIEQRMRERGFDMASAYFETHRERFGELFRVLDALQERRPVESIAEIGCVYFTTAFYREVLPGVKLFTVDRPTADGGEDAAWAAAAGSDVHFNVDLNRSPLAQALGGPVDRLADVVVCCEVIEHVMVSPVEMLTDLLALLRPGGVIVLTTPNFLAMSSLRIMQAGRNPGTMFDRAVGNEDAHYHVREYTMSELTEACVTAGAEVQLAAYSHCWDRGDPVVMQSDRHALRKNMTLVIGRAGDEPWLG